MVILLLTLVALDQLAIRPLARFLTSADSRIASLRESTRQAQITSERAQQLRPRLGRARRRMRGAGAEQVEFRRELADLAGPGVNVRSSRQVSARDVPAAADLRRVTYELRLSGRLDPLLDVLKRLDESRELLQVDNLDIRPADEGDGGLDMTLTISTLAHKRTS